MDKDHKNLAAGKAPPMDPPGLSTKESEKPAFVPLRLVLYPNGVTMSLDRADMVVGRHSHADLRLHLPDVSRRHCRFVFAEGEWQVLDLGSTNGVFVNDTRVDRAVLHQLDLIRIGSYTFEVQLGDQKAASPPDGADHREPARETPEATHGPANTPQRRAS